MDEEEKGGSGGDREYCRQGKLFSLVEQVKGCHQVKGKSGKSPVGGDTGGGV